LLPTNTAKRALIPGAIGFGGYPLTCGSLPYFFCFSSYVCLGLIRLATYFIQGCLTKTMFPNVLLAILATLGIGVAALGMGGWIGFSLPPKFSRFDRVVCVWLGGLGILGTVLFLIGQLVLTRKVIFVVVMGAWIAAIRPIIRLVRDISPASLRLTNIDAIPAAFIVFILLVTAVAGLNQITGDMGHDAISYHLLGPKVWIREGIVRPVLDSCHTAFPSVGEILYAALLGLGRQLAPGFSAVVMFTMFLSVVGSLAVRTGLDLRHAWWVVALVATMPAVYGGAHSCFVDVLYAGFVLAAVRIGWDAQRVREYAAFGLFCGLAMGTKYSGLIAVALLAVLIACRILSGRRSDYSSSFHNLGIALLVATLVSAPFYVRNWIEFGFPIYPPPPILSDIFHVRYLSPQAISRFHAYIQQRGAGLGRGPRAFLLLPFNLTYHTSNFHGAGGIGLVPLALGPLGLIAGWRHDFAKALAIVGFLFTLAWFVTQQESRFLIPVYVIAAVLGGLGWRYAISVEARWAPSLCACVIGCSLVYGSYMIVSGRRDDLHAVFSPSYAARQRQARIPFVESFDYLNRTQSVRKVLILDPNVPPYYCDVSYLKPFGRWGEQVLPNVPDVTNALEQLRDLYISHIFDVSTDVSAFRVPQNTRGLTLVFEEPHQRIYRVD
jgi:hypothetical protein